MTAVEGLWGRRYKSDPSKPEGGDEGSSRNARSKLSGAQKEFLVPKQCKNHGH